MGQFLVAILPQTGSVLTGIQQTRDFEDPRTSARVIQRLVAVPDVLAEFPRMGVVLQDFVPRDVRRFIVDDYEIRYELTEATLFITDVFHTRQDRETFH